MAGKWLWMLCAAAATLLPVTGSGDVVRLIRIFDYPQTPEFTDQTRPDAASGIVDTVWSLRKKDRMSQPLTDRRRFGFIRMIYVTPGALEPERNYVFAPGALIPVEYQPGTFTFSGSADSLVGITNFAWGTENNNGNFLPLLVSRDYQDVKTPAFEFSWSTPPEYRTDGGRLIPVNNIITLNYNFRIPAQPRVDRADAPSFRRFSPAGSMGSRLPQVVADAIFRWSEAGLEVFSADLTRQKNVGGNLRPRSGNNIAGFAVDPGSGRIFIASGKGTITAYTLDGTAYWEKPGSAPLIVHQDKLFSVSPDYRRLQWLSVKDGSTVGSCELPALTPRNENSMATVSTPAGDLLLLSIPMQSRILFFHIRRGEE